MKLIANRGLWKQQIQQNTLSAFESAFRAGYAVQADLRTHGGQLFLSREPIGFPQGLPHLDALLRLASHEDGSRVFLRVREQGLLALLKPFESVLVDINVVFCDLSVADIVRYSGRFPASMLATRASDLELQPPAAALCEWLCIEGFERDLNAHELRTLATTYPRLRRVFSSPEIQGRNKEPLWQYLTQAPDAFALCTDQPNAWPS